MEKYGIHAVRVAHIWIAVPAIIAFVPSIYAVELILSWPIIFWQINVKYWNHYLR